MILENRTFVYTNAFLNGFSTHDSGGGFVNDCVAVVCRGAIIIYLYNETFVYTKVWVFDKSSGCRLVVRLWRTWGQGSNRGGGPSGHGGEERCYLL